MRDAATRHSAAWYKIMSSCSTAFRRTVFERLDTSASQGASLSLRSLAEIKPRRMPRYFFHVPNHQPSFAHEGTELPDLVAARREAVIYLATILKDQPSLLGLSDTLRVQVHDSDDRCLLVVNMQVIEVGSDET